MIVLKGHYDITTSAPDNDIVHTGHDLFSHPDTYQWHGESEPRPDHRVSRENLFSEPVDPNRPAPVSDGQTERPPRDPFRSDTDELS